MAESHDSNGSTGGPDDALADLFDGQELGTMLLGQLSELVDSWAKVIEVVAEHGIDPTPLLQSLARTLRATADQLDPATPRDP
jgi:hypothetical protein